MVRSFSAALEQYQIIVISNKKENTVEFLSLSMSSELFQLSYI
jgi:hypothetical protein